MSTHADILDALEQAARGALHPDERIGELRRAVARLALELAIARARLRLAEEKADRE